MTTLKAVFSLIASLPELIALLKSIQAAIDEAATERRVKGDILKIKTAFDKKDPKLLHDLFANKLQSPKTDD